MEGPDSSYSALEIHICWKVERDAKIDPPIQTTKIKYKQLKYFFRKIELLPEYFLSGGATTLIFIVEGANAVSSLVILSAIPGNIVVPPEYFERRIIARKRL
jgi:hypothetical protein